jgi:hypothetical protein
MPSSLSSFPASEELTSDNDDVVDGGAMICRQRHREMQLNFFATDKERERDREITKRRETKNNDILNVHAHTPDIIAIRVELHNSKHILLQSRNIITLVACLHTTRLLRLAQTNITQLPRVPRSHISGLIFLTHSPVSYSITIILKCVSRTT